MLIQDPNLICIVLVVSLVLIGIGGILAVISDSSSLRKKDNIKLRKAMKIAFIIGALLFAFLIVNGAIY